MCLPNFSPGGSANDRMVPINALKRMVKLSATSRCLLMIALIVFLWVLNRANTSAGDLRVVECVQTGRINELRDLLGDGANSNAVAALDAVDGGCAQKLFSYRAKLFLLCQFGPQCNMTSALTMTSIAPRVHYEDEGKARSLMARMLLACGANVNGTAGEFHSPLVAAVARKQGDLVNVMLEHGADPNAADASGQTPLLAAIKSGDTIIILELVKAGANVNRSAQMAKPLSIAYIPRRNRREHLPSRLASTTCSGFSCIRCLSV